MINIDFGDVCIIPALVVFLVGSIVAGSIIFVVGSIVAGSVIFVVGCVELFLLLIV